MNNAQNVITKATKMRNLMRPGPMENNARPTRPVDAVMSGGWQRESAPPIVQQQREPAAKPVQSPPVYPEPPVQAKHSVYGELMKKHDQLNPRYR